MDRYSVRTVLDRAEHSGPSTQGECGLRQKPAPFTFGHTECSERRYERRLVIIAGQDVVSEKFGETFRPGLGAGGPSMLVHRPYGMAETRFYSRHLPLSDSLVEVGPGETNEQRVYRLVNVRMSQLEKEIAEAKRSRHRISGDRPRKPGCCPATRLPEGSHVLRLMQVILPGLFREVGPQEVCRASLFD